MTAKFQKDISKMIPAKISLSGDKVRAEKLRAFGLSQLQILQEQMTFQDLKQGTRRVSFEDGSFVKIKSVFGLNEVSIFVPLVIVEKAEVEELAIRRTNIDTSGGRLGLRAGPVIVAVCDPEIILPISWPDDKNPETMERGTDSLIYIEGGMSPYKWEIEGQGYWFDENYTLTVLENIHANVPGWCSPSIGETQEICEGNGGTWRYLGCRVRLYADNTICGIAQIKVTDVCEQVVNGEVPYDKALKWFDENPTEMDRGDKLLLYIVNGEAPYLWRVEGKGFWFDEDHTLTEVVTSDKHVFFYAEESSIVPIDIWPFHAGACTPAKIIVTDDCEVEVNGRVDITDQEVLAWPEDEEIKPLEVCANDETMLAWEGGVPPFFCAVDTAHFGFDWHMLPWTFSLNRNIMVHSGSAICGVEAIITITDTCGSKIDKKIKTAEVGLAIAWDYDNSDATIDTGESDVPICIIGGVPPYKWEVSPSDKFVLGATETEGSTNTLSAAGAACGACAITVTDCCGEECIGYVRCTAGQWTFKSNTCQLLGSVGSVSNIDAWSFDVTATVGNKKQVLYYDYQGSSERIGTSWFETQAEAIADCEATLVPQYCSGTYDCLDYSQPCASGGAPNHSIPCGKDYENVCRDACGVKYRSAVPHWAGLMHSGAFYAITGAKLNYYEWECAP